jgi:hypothetical protein
VNPATGIEPRTVSDAEMAWLLVDAAASCLADVERTGFFVELGSGESYLAIEHILTAVISSRTRLPVTVLSALTSWLHGYSGSPAEVQLRKMYADIRLQQFQVISGDRGATTDEHPHRGRSNTSGMARRSVRRWRWSRA